jgi:YfiH family protein
MTADCLPVFFWTQSGDQIAAVHAGWRGLANGILGQALQVFPDPGRVICGIGPAISVHAFEVGLDVVTAFQHSPDYEAAFLASDRPDKYLCNLPLLAERQLRAAGVTRIYQSDLCTFENASLFYSYRRDGQTGRMANLIWKV